MARNAEIFFEHDNWGRSLGWSAGFHIAVTALILLYTAVFTGPRGQGWGSGGGGSAIGVSLVSSVPLPATAAQTQNVLANESKGVTKSEPKPQEQEKEPDAIEIQGKNSKIKPKKTPTPTKEKPKPAPEQESNQVAFGEGGPVSGPYGSFAAGGAKGGFGVTGGGGDFGTRFGWYVQIIQRKVSENWLKYEVDPRISSAQRVYITFDVARDGHPFNVRVEQSSGVPSLDVSATRALERIDTFGPLPPDYSGSKISVEYWFDYSKK
ncbi:MAG: TonB family protein [Acidobacteriaceae bacterium]|jgi:periplasmic protein TonB